MGIVRYTPVEMIRASIPVIRVGKDVLPCRKVEIAKEPVQFITGEVGVPGEDERVHADMRFLFVQFKGFLVESFYFIGKPLGL